MSLMILERNDKLKMSSSYISVYKINKLYKIKTHFRKIILRVIKKTLLGTNYIYFYSNQSIIFVALFNLIIINLNFLLFPQLINITKSYINDNEPDVNDIDKDLNNNSEYHKLFNPNKLFKKIIHLFILNLFDIIILLIKIINYKYKQKKINNYMKKYTQCAIGIENEIIKNKYNCVLSKDGKFNIEIYSTKNKNNENIKILYMNIMKDKYFFEYVINIPNVRILSRYLYKKIYLPKEKEIINRIIGISNEIEYKYKKKLLKILICILLYIPLINIFMDVKKINYFGILILLLFVERNNFFKNKNEQIQRVSLLNNEYINNGYFIYINNDIISIFFVKQQFRNIESIEIVKKLNEKLLYEFEII